MSSLSAVTLASPAIADSPPDPIADQSGAVPETTPVPVSTIAVPVESIPSSAPETLAPDFSTQWSSDFRDLDLSLNADIPSTVQASSQENHPVSLEEDMASSELPPVPPSRPPDRPSIEPIEGEPLTSPPPPGVIAELPPASSPAFSPLPLTLDDSLDQLTSVAQLEDVQPTDWSYQALQSLVERYGVVVGYPDGTFQGDRPLTRYEFAAALNAALDGLNHELQSGLIDAATQDDLAVLQRLQREFAVELATLEEQVDTLESRTTYLEANQFSTTVQLGGEAIFGLATAGGGDPPGTGEANPVFTYRSELQLFASFTGRDAFRVGLSAGNFEEGGFANPFVLNTNMALMSYQSGTGDSVELSSLEYRFAVGDRLVFTVKPYGFDLTTVLNVNSIYSDSGEGALSRFASYNPLFRIGGLDAGVGVDFLLSDRTRLQIAYGGRNAGDPLQGLLASDHRALGVQLLARPFNQVTTGIAYINAFSDNGYLDTFTGSNNADTSGGFDEAAAIHGLAGTLQWRITPGLILGAWGGVTVTDSLPSDAGALSTTYLVSLGFPDPFGREGDLLGLMVGQPLRLRAGINIEQEDEGAGMHYEAFYRFRVNDHIAITPGFFIVTDPGHISDNETIFVGAIRTTIRF